MNRIFSIATGTSCKTQFWHNIQLRWPEILHILETPVRTKETYAAYMQMSKDKQGDIKDVGGFVGGYLQNGKRSNKTVGFRSLITLDLDYADINLWDRMVTIFQNIALVLHGTHKHSINTPRYRLIIPLYRDVTPEEYVAISRKIAEIIGIELFDKTTFQTERLMFYPSVSSDAEYYFKSQEGGFLDPDYILSLYHNWRDISTHPYHNDEVLPEDLNRASLQQDPLDKSGIVGAFCRSYSIVEAIDTFLSDKYKRETDGRYSYAEGSTSNGLVIYDDKFAYSHHSTDPAHLQLCNAFDLVRIHLFGHLDIDHDKNSKKVPPSFTAFHSYISNDPKIKKDRLRELEKNFSIQLNAANNIPERIDPREAFKNFVPNSTPSLESGQSLNLPENLQTVPPSEISTTSYPPSKYRPEFNIQDSPDGWQDNLLSDKKGIVANSFNLNLIFANDIEFKGKFYYNSFEENRYIIGKTFWKKDDSFRRIKDVDYAGIRQYLDMRYGIRGKELIDDALHIVFEFNRFDPVKDYLLSQKWDGQKRIDTILQKLFGAKDNEYTRECMRLFMGAAVSRIFHPGCKFDNVLTLAGPEGLGKSTFFKNLAGDWFSDSFNSITGKEAFEQLQGAWIMEVAELSGFRKHDVEKVKQYLSKREDVYRPSYGHTVDRFPRKCVFCATTNEDRFLQGDSNRRFWPITVNMDKSAMSVFSEEFKNNVGQLWAEAVSIATEKGFLVDMVVRDMNKEAKEIAQKERSVRTNTDDRIGLVEEYLSIKIPEDFSAWTADERARYYLEDQHKTKGTTKRTKVSAMEIWVECLGGNKNDLDFKNSNAVRNIMRSLKQWQPKGESIKYRAYGNQLVYTLND